VKTPFPTEQRTEGVQGEIGRHLTAHLGCHSVDVGGNNPVAFLESSEQS
jgi:hypothetical protein